jgi:hypothetical protein
MKRERYINSMGEKAKVKAKEREREREERERGREIPKILGKKNEG